MKRISALIILAALMTLNPLRAADSSATPEVCIRNFYHWYVTNLVANRDPMEKGPNGLDGDYFVDAQDFDPLWASKIQISAVQIHGDKASAQVVLDGAKGMRRKLLVQL